MGDPAATLRALADACEKCHQFAKLANDVECISAQRITLMRALPDVTGWPATAAELRTMADTVDRLTRERDEARALLATPKPKRDPLTDPIPSGPPLTPPLHGIAVMLNEFMEPGAMLLVCGSAAFARIKSEVPNA